MSPTPQKHIIRGENLISGTGTHQIAVYDYGDPMSDHVVVCVHGLTRNARDFDLLAEELGRRKRRVLSISMAGRGESSWLQDPADYNYTTYMTDCLKVLDNFHLRQVDWVGTSMGGIIGMLLASQPGTPITRMVLNDVGPVITAASLRRIGQYVGRAPRFADVTAAEAYIREVGAPFGALTDAQWRHLTEYSVRRMDDAEGGYAMIYDPGLGEVFRLNPVPVDIDLWPVYEAIRCPTLALRGAESDLLEASTLAAMGTRGPRARTVEFSGVGHAPMLMDPAQIAVVRDFLLGT